MSAGNRPHDVCALCDRPIDGVGDGSMTHRGTGVDYHLYIGPGWVHGGGREEIAVHWSCVVAKDGNPRRIPGWVPDGDYAAWLGDWESRSGPFKRHGASAIHPSRRPPLRRRDR